MKEIEGKGGSLIRMLKFSVLCIGVSACVEAKSGDFVPVGVSGVNNLGRDFNVSSLYLDLGYHGNVGRGEGGAGLSCCVLLPKTWRPGLRVDIRWTVDDWSKENVKETDAGNFRSVRSVGAYKAIVPVEHYDEVGTLYVHLFPKGKVRVLSSQYGALSSKHPVLQGDKYSERTATQGKKILKIFTLSEMRKLEENARVNRRSQ